MELRQFNTQNIRHDHKKFNCPGDVAPGICALLTYFVISYETDIQPTKLPNSLHQIFRYKLVVTKLVQKFTIVNAA
jgi:hypothetical protein